MKKLAFAPIASLIMTMLVPNVVFAYGEAPAGGQVLGASTKKGIPTSDVVWSILLIILILIALYLYLRFRNRK